VCSSQLCQNGTVTQEQKAVAEFSRGAQIVQDGYDLKRFAIHFFAGGRQD
jgi:hypothetical protein